MENISARPIPEYILEVFIKLEFISPDCFLTIWIYGRVVVSKAERLAISARESLSSYCYKECLAYCCRKGYLLLSEKEVNLLCLDIKDLTIMPIDKRYIFNLGKGCPNLINYKCIIHKNSKRPKACREFPLFISEDKIIITEDCPAIKANMLYPFLAEFKAMGFTLIYSEK
jgi:Fe-S-cluster containining protein